MAKKPYAELPYLERELRVLNALKIAGGQLSHQQVTMGPLRHLAQEDREIVLHRLFKVRFIEMVKLKPPRGRTAPYYRLTDKGRREIPESTT